MPTGPQSLLPASIAEEVVGGHPLLLDGETGDAQEVTMDTAIRAL